MSTLDSSLFFDEQPAAPAIEPKAPYADCWNCPLADRPCVPSHMPTGAALLVVGEAPGRNELEQGRPFVGQSGQLLDHIARQSGIDPASIARTNAVLCRPDGNATPPTDAIVACSKRLAAEINRLAPQVIVPMGNTALTAVDWLSHKTRQIGGTITSRRGKWYDLSHYRVLPTFHPAYVLRQPDLMPQVTADFQKAVGGLRTNTSEGRVNFKTDAVKYIPCTPENQHRVIEYLNRMPDGAVLAFDVESDHLQWYDTPTQQAADVLAIGLAWKPNQVVVIPVEMLLYKADDTNFDYPKLELAYPKLYAAIKSAFERGKPTAHNGKFDQHNLALLDLFPVLAYDTMLAHYVLNEEKGTHGLKQLVMGLLDCDDDYEHRLIDSWFIENKIKKEDRRYSLIPKERLYEYLAIDVAATFQLWNVLKIELEATELLDWPFNSVLMPIANAIEHVEENGIRVDRAYLHELGEYITYQMGLIEQPMKDLVRKRVVSWLAVGNIKVPKADWIKDQATYARCIAKCRDAFNAGSWQQVQVFLYDILKLQHTKRLGYKADPRSTQEENLLSLQPNDTSGFVDMLFTYRRLEKIRGTYVEKLLQLADTNDRVHINFLVHGTVIGRLSATDALHGIPRPGDDEYGAAIRGAFIASDGCVLVIADYSQAELRVFAAESQETFLLTIFNEDRDPHGEANQMLFAGDQLIDDAVYDRATQSWHWPHDATYYGVRDVGSYWKERRTTAKNVVFGGLVYQGKAHGIASMLGGKLATKQIEPLLARLLVQMPTAANWQAAQFRRARSQGFVKSRFGRMRRFPLITDDNLEEIRKASVHMPIASGASDLTQLSIVEIDKAGYRVVGTWHDSIICDVPIEQAEACAACMESTMVSMGEKWYPEVAWKAEIEHLADGSFPTRWYSKIPDLSIPT